MTLKCPRVAYRLILVVIIPTRFEDVVMDVCDHGMGIHSQLGLKREQLATAKQEHIEHTLKTCRILLKSDFQAAIVSLSFFA